MSFQGTITATVTPFSKDGSLIDINSLNRFLEFQRDSGINGIVACGSTGEGQILSDEEYTTVVKSVVNVGKGKFSVIAGIGTNSTSRACSIAKHAKELGVDGLLVVAPPYNKPPQRGILEHYRAIYNATKLPIVAYNIPGRSSVNITPATLATLASEGTITSVKESSGSVDQVIDIMAASPKSLSMLSGEDSLTVSLMAMGAKGVICTTSNLLPKNMLSVTDKGLRGDFVGAASELYTILPAIRCMFQDTNPIPLKWSLYKAKLIDHPAVRLPLMEPEVLLQQKIEEIVSKFVK